MDKISFKLAVKSIIVIITLVVVFHLLVLIEVIPYDIVWGGRLTSREQMIQYECSSLFINIFMLFIVAMKSRLIKPVLKDLFTNILLWLFVTIFALNTIGNLLAFNSLETYIFTPITFILSILFARVALEKN